MNPPSVLLDHSFLVAVGDCEDSNHDAAVARYRDMINDFVELRCLLVARADHLSAVSGGDLFAPIDKLHVARQHRNAATELVAHTGAGIDEAITLVLLHRYKIRQVASFSEHLATYETDAKVTVPAKFVVSDTPDGARVATVTPEAG